MKKSTRPDVILSTAVFVVIVAFLSAATFVVVTATQPQREERKCAYYTR